MRTDLRFSFFKIERKSSNRWAAIRAITVAIPLPQVHFGRQSKERAISGETLFNQ